MTAGGEIWVPVDTLFGDLDTGRLNAESQEHQTPQGIRKRVQKGGSLAAHGEEGIFKA